MLIKKKKGFAETDTSAYLHRTDLWHPDQLDLCLHYLLHRD